MYVLFYGSIVCDMGYIIDGQGCIRRVWATSWMGKDVLDGVVKHAMPSVMPSGATPYPLYSYLGHVQFALGLGYMD